jgi:rubrerythrin
MDPAMQQELLAGLRQAMQAERTGFEFYAAAADKTDDPVGRETFRRLAQEENDHFNFLSSHYRSLIERGTFDPSAHLGPPEVTAEQALFSPALRGRLGQAHFEMSALAIAVQLELNAINHYRSQAQKAKTPEARKLFEDFVAWETGHYEAFLRQQQALQDDYWNAGGFEPF